MVDVVAAAGVQFRRPASGREHQTTIGAPSASPSAGPAPRLEPDYKPIEMPRNSPTGFICAFFATFAGFGMIWQIWWLVIVSLIGAFATFVVFAWRDRTEYEIPAEEVARIDRANRRARGEALATAEALS